MLILLTHFHWKVWYNQTFFLCLSNCRHVYWANAFPLYARDYDSVLEAIGTLEQELPGFYYAGEFLMPMTAMSKNYILFQNMRKFMCQYLFYLLNLRTKS